jgi:hypothetical protein
MLNWVYSHKLTSFNVYRVVPNKGTTLFYLTKRIAVFVNQQPAPAEIFPNPIVHGAADRNYYIAATGSIVDPENNFDDDSILMPS